MKIVRLLSLFLLLAVILFCFASCRKSQPGTNFTPRQIAENIGEENGSTAETRETPPPNYPKADEDTAILEVPQETSLFQFPDHMNDAYDPAAILAAWGSGDTSGLSAKNKSIFAACTDVISSLITDAMSDYEKELAIHDWIIDWADYDVETKSNSPNAKPDPDNDNPYGVLLHKKGICGGYTSTFQLFMDMLEIECITVAGVAESGEEHAWNMVKLNGEWYCVDVTWDDPVNDVSIYRPFVKHTYFNVPSRVISEAGHRWDISGAPEATAPKLYFE